MQHIIRWLTEEAGDERASLYIQWFNTNFKPESFKGINSLLLCYVKYCAKLNIKCNRYNLDVYLRIDAMSDIKKYRIKVDEVQAYNYEELSQLMEATSILTNICLATYDAAIQEPIEGKDIKVELYDFISRLQSDSIMGAILAALPKLEDGSNKADVSRKLRSDLTTIDREFDTDSISGLDYEGCDDDDNMRLICKTDVPAIDSDVGGIFSKMIYTINAQPAGGKTRFTLANFVYPALCAGKDVLYYSTELSKAQVKNILVAYHVSTKYRGMVKIPDTLINKGQTTPEMDSYIYSAREVLFSGHAPGMGRLIINTDCYADTLLDEINSYKAADPNLDLVVIDYMGLLEMSHPDKYRSAEQYQVITEGYKAVRKAVRKLDMAAVCVNQFNDEGIKSALAGKPIKSGDIQGGHIVHRHTDYNLDITYTEVHKSRNQRLISVSKTRGSEGFTNVVFNTQLGISVFEQSV